MDLQKLAEPFPQADVEWRAQSLTRDGKKAMALAYIDARAVMQKLDEVCTPAGWQSSYAETPKGRVICTISIKIGDEWVSKSDGAGDTAVEGQKGAISDALKRAAVHWGIGRYLYDMDAVWVPCETYQQGGKDKFKKFTADPWQFVRSHGQPRQTQDGTTPSARPKQDNKPDPRAFADALKRKIADAADAAALNKVWDSNANNFGKLENMAPEIAKSAKDAFTLRMGALSQAPHSDDCPF